MYYSRLSRDQVPGPNSPVGWKLVSRALGSRPGPTQGRTKSSESNRNKNRRGVRMKIQLMEGKAAERAGFVLCALFCLLLLVLGTPFTLNAQQYSGTITGTVT